MTNTIERGTNRRRRTIIGSTIAAAVSVLSLGLGASAANAGTAGDFGIGHVDAFFVSLNSSENALQLGTNVDEDGYDPSWGYDDGYYGTSEINATSSLTEPAYTFTVPAAAYNSTTHKWVIPSTEPDFSTNPVLWAGFAGAGENVPNRVGGGIGAHNLFDVLTTDDTVTVKLELINTVAHPAPGTVTFSGSTGNGQTATPFTFNFPLTENEEAFHVHTEATFSAAGTYFLKATASTDNGDVSDSSSVYYEFDVQPVAP